MAFAFKPFSRKQLHAVAFADSFINIFEGAVRSGKTIASIVSWIDFVKNSPHNEFLMSGKTSDTLYRNVVEDIEKIVGIKRARYIKSSKGGAKLIFTFKDAVTGKKIKKTCYCVGANDERAEGNIRGMTVAGWYADEVTLYPEGFVKQAINRMSLDGARAIWTTNPDSPYHYIKTEFIDKAEEKGYKSWHFDIDDNLALSDRYKDNIKKAYTGLWYKRMIQGLWVMAEGVIYDMFSAEKHVIETNADYADYEDFMVGVDYGTHNPCVFLLFGKKGETWYILKEYYHDSSTAGRQKTDAEYSADMQHFLGDLKGKVRVYIDPSAASFIEQLSRDGIRTIQADNSVLDGIRTVSNYLENGTLFIDSSCKSIVKEFFSYVWDDKAQKRGEDKPLKTSDHALDACRYALYTDSLRKDFASDAPIGIDYNDFFDTGGIYQHM